MGARSYFTRHPQSAGETYWEHFRVAMGVARHLGGAAVAAAVHAVVPEFHTTTASDRIHALHHCLENGNREAIKQHGPLEAAEVLTGS